MPFHKIVLAGGNGYLGGVLAAYYSPLAEEVVLLSRSKAPTRGNIRTVVWDATREGAWAAELRNADLLVNLCGKNVNCRYTRKNRQAILRSRVRPTALLGRVIRRLTHPPALWINVTSATIYRHAEDRPQDEAHGELGKGFSVDICRSWERVFFAAETPGVRKVALRMGIVFGAEDGVFPRLQKLVSWGLGGPQGNGRQYVSWIHETDAARVTEWLLHHPEMEGAINCTAPYPVTNEEQMRIIRGGHWGLPAPAWLLSIGARLIGTETELILKSRWVLPTRLENAGFVFKYAHLEDAVAEIRI
ncbi:TIGR01777 family oxidoreductase [Dinghuibacter silviterrae]|uniref:DUF1731 domain-containing protein n=1 Tax=Dinghuibacter silviterrae TaxID=1539049 RepID=A0A4R8DWJ0_9BACT|nr:TIGR01777 family oxidoreductase [Dinghuibacter silviterrae]TDX01875.1 hypothetical protein EDB95_2919 [Dinghuibacter silviterrae]